MLSEIGVKEEDYDALAALQSAFTDLVTVFDTVDANFNDKWLENLDKALNNRKPDYLVVQHMEPDHSANIFNFAKKYPDALIVANAKTFVMMKQFFGTEFEDRK